MAFPLYDQLYLYCQEWHCQISDWTIFILGAEWNTIVYLLRAGSVVKTNSFSSSGLVVIQDLS